MSNGKIGDGLLTKIIWAAITPFAPDQEGNVVRWLRNNDWRMPLDNDGKKVYLSLMDADELQAAAVDPSGEFGQWLWHSYCKALPKPMADTQPIDPPAEAPTKANNEIAPSQVKPHRELDDDTLAQEVLEFLRDNRADEFTYNQVKEALSIADFKQVSRVLRRLAERGTEVVQYEIKGTAKKTTVWKYAPERKILDRDYSRAAELVGEAILGFLAAKPYQSENAICTAMRRYFGYLDDHCVRATLKLMIDDGTIIRTPGARRANLHSIP